MTYTDKTNSLTPFEYAIIEQKHTEPPGSGHYLNQAGYGTYLCRRCGIALFRASHQFTSGCGWPSFDDEIEGRIKQIPDRDGFRTEILCQRCEGHLGHIFEGEGLTAKNKRHCVNAASIDFVLDKTIQDSDEVIIAGGCFWGVEYLLQQMPGVVMAQSGYCGGHTEAPTYEQVCSGTTGHVEAVRVMFDSGKTTAKRVLTRFFNSHDPTQADGQGPDRGSQYLSMIFCHNDNQKAIAASLIEQLQTSGYQVATTIEDAAPFWPAEDYHQQYYAQKGSQPYCHTLVSRLPESD